MHIHFNTLSFSKDTHELLLRSYIMFCLLILMIMPLIIHSSILLPSVSNATLIAHPSSGIFMQYVGEYVPSDLITNISIVIPLTAVYCNIVPLVVVQNIPQCAHVLHSINFPRYTRQIGEGWVALGVAGTAVALATENRYAISTIKKN